MRGGGLGMGCRVRLLALHEGFREGSIWEELVMKVFVLLTLGGPVLLSSPPALDPPFPNSFYQLIVLEYE